MVTWCLMLVGLSWGVGCLLTWWWRGLGRRLGQVDRPGRRKIHEQPVPATGGAAIFMTLVLMVGLGYAMIWLAGPGWWGRWVPAMVEHLEGARRQAGMAGGLLAVLGLLHAMGWVDDRRGLGPAVKAAVQGVAAGVMVLGFDVRLMEWAGPVVSVVLSILWLMVLTNAFNFLDNMDGLSGGVAVLCGGMLMGAALLSGQWFIAALLGVVVGAVGGFLVFNRPPASIFMGDCGSLVVGFVLGFAAIRVTYYDPAEPASRWWAVLTPLVVMAIPLYDFVSVTLLRLRQGRSPFVGDRQHFSHRLVRRGLSRGQAVLVVHACTLATGLGGVMLGRLAGWQAGLVAGQTAAVLGVVAMLEWAGGGGRFDEPIGTGRGGTER